MNLRYRFVRHQLILSALDPPQSLNRFSHQDDDEFCDDNKVLDEYRKRRLDELKIAKFFNRFGDVYEISKADWVND